MIDSAGNAFKNQGACVSFYATEREQPRAGDPAP